MKYSKICINKDCSHLFSFNELTVKNHSWDVDKANNNGPVIKITKSGPKILNGAMHHRCCKCNTRNVVARPVDLESYLNSVKSILPFYIESEPWVSDLIDTDYLSKIC